MEMGLLIQILRYWEIGIPSSTGNMESLKNLFSRPLRNSSIITMIFFFELFENNEERYEKPDLKSDKTVVYMFKHKTNESLKVG